MEEEIWKDIENFEGLYQVSNMGRVKSFRSRKILKGILMNKGYYIVNLYDRQGKYHFFLVHRLVAEAFIPNPQNKKDIDHINTIRTDNRVSNLRWATRSENCRNPITYARSCLASKRVAKRGHESRWAKPIYQYSKDLQLIATYISARDASEATGIKMSKIDHAARGEQTQAGGFIWKRTKI